MGRPSVRGCEGQGAGGNQFNASPAAVLEAFGQDAHSLSELPCYKECPVFTEAIGFMKVTGFGRAAELARLTGFAGEPELTKVSG